MNMTNCPICNGKIEHTSKTIEYLHKNNVAQIKQSGEYCLECGESFLSPKDLKSTKKDIADFKHQISFSIQ